MVEQSAQKTNVIPIEIGRALKKKPPVRGNDTEKDRTRDRRLIELLLIALDIAKETDRPAHM